MPLLVSFLPTRTWKQSFLVKKVHTVTYLLLSVTWIMYFLKGKIWEYHYHQHHYCSSWSNMFKEIQLMYIVKMIIIAWKIQLLVIHRWFQKSQIWWFYIFKNKCLKYSKYEFSQVNEDILVMGKIISWKLFILYQGLGLGARVWSCVYLHNFFF